VVLIDQWPAHVEAMRANGLTVTLRQGEIHAKVRAHHLCDLAAMNQTSTSCSSSPRPTTRAGTPS